MVNRALCISIGGSFDSSAVGKGGKSISKVSTPIRKKSSPFNNGSYPV